MKRWIATFLAVFLAVSTVGQASLAAGMPCGLGLRTMAVAEDSGAVADQDDHRHCRKPAANGCSDICKRLCSNAAFFPPAVAEPAPAVPPAHLQPSLVAHLLSRATPPDTPPPIA